MYEIDRWLQHKCEGFSIAADRDFYVGRVIISYVGPGTCAADDKSILWDVFDLEDNSGCVSRDDMMRMQTNSVLLMKGSAWPKVSRQ